VSETFFNPTACIESLFLYTAVPLNAAFVDGYPKSVCTFSIQLNGDPNSAFRFQIGHID